MKQLDKNKLQAVANQVGRPHPTASCCSGQGDGVAEAAGARLLVEL